MQPNIYSRGDIVTLSVHVGSKVRPVLILRQNPDGGLVVLTLSSADFGGLGLPVWASCLRRKTYVSPQISLYYAAENWAPNIIGAVDAGQMETIEDRLLDYLFSHMLD